MKAPQSLAETVIGDRGNEESQIDGESDTEYIWKDDAYEKINMCIIPRVEIVVEASSP